jgi:hypothetical protein
MDVIKKPLATTTDEQAKDAAKSYEVTVAPSKNYQAPPP